MILQYPPRRLGSVSVIPVEDDSRILVPPTLQPVTQFPSVYTAQIQGNAVNPVPAGTFISESHIGQATKVQGASAAADRLFLSRLSAGLWELNMTVRAFSGVGTHIQTGIGLLLPNGSQAFELLFLFVVAASGPEFLTDKLLLNIQDNGYQPFLDVSATGVGESHQAACRVLFNRLA